MNGISKDILYVMIALSVFLVALCISWVLYYLAQILKQGNDALKEVRQRVEEFHESMERLKEKVTTSASSLAFLAKEVSHIMGFVKDQRQKKSKKTGQSAPSEKK